MAGSYKHVVTNSGRLRRNEGFLLLIGDLGDAYEAIEEMYGMIWVLAEGDPAKVEDARQRYSEGLSGPSSKQV